MYDIYLLDDIHNFFPAFLYNQSRFTNMADVFAYVNRQMDTHFNIFNRAQREYNQRNVRASTAPQPQRTVDILPLYASQNTASMSELFTLLSGLYTNTAPTQFNMDPVVVRPTANQIVQATTVEMPVFVDQESTCSVCQEGYILGQTVRKINHCSHKFHKLCIDTWFSENVHCPVCRYDIRDFNQNAT